MNTPMYWSVRRELWENRSIYFAPMAVATAVQFAVLIRTITLPRRMPAILALDPLHRRESITMPYSAIAGLLIMTAFLVGVFYCLDALHGERRDRSILFWKSLPVSDRTTVLSKASIPLVILPLIVFAIAIAAQFILLLFSSLMLLRNGPALAALWDNVQFLQSSLALLYAVTTIALWHAPVYAWLLLVSVSVRHGAFVWAVLPLLALAAVEKVAFNTTHLLMMLGHRLGGWFQVAFFFPPKDSKVVLEPFAYLTPGKFLSAPGLWIGLLLAVAFLAAAVRMRRYRQPI